MAKTYTFEFFGPVDCEASKNAVTEFANRHQGSFKYASHQGIRGLEVRASYSAVIPSSQRSTALDEVRMMNRKLIPNLYFQHHY
jgi:uncharacterized caspase-like protein